MSNSNLGNTGSACDVATNACSGGDHIDVNQISMAVIKDLQAGRLDVPSLPEVAIRIGKVVSDESTDNADVARVIQADPALTARFLSTVNSPAYAGYAKVERLSDAVTRLGRKRTRALVVSLVLRTAFRVRSIAVRNRMERLWGHSTLIASLCYILTQSIKHLDQDRALLAGLVHDIGVVPLLRKAAAYPALAGSPEALDRYVNALRPTCGAYILQKWGFSEDLIEAARSAQQCSRSHDHRVDYTDILIIAHLIALSTEAGKRMSIPFQRVPAVIALTHDMNHPFSVCEFLDNASRDINTLQNLLAG